MNEWDQLPDEPPFWFDRFERYRKAGVKRTALGIYHTEREAKDRAEWVASGRPESEFVYKKASTLPGSWADALTRWNWKERAEAFDRSEFEKERAVEMAKRDAEREARRNMVDVVREKVLERFERLDADTLDNKELLAFAKFVNDESRKEFEIDTTRVELTGRDGERLESGTTVQITLDERIQRVMALLATAKGRRELAEKEESIDDGSSNVSIIK